MNSDFLLSIVVPAYNASKFLDKFFACVEAQSKRFFEVIIVDDGSRDDTYQRLLSYQPSAKDYRLIIIHQENCGQNMARLKGLSVASGEYVWFVDVDDTFTFDAVKQIGETIQLGSFPDCAIFLMKRHHSSGEVICDKALFPTKTIFRGDERHQILSIALGTSKMNSLWLKVFKREKLIELVKCINGIPFLRYGEDFVISSLFLERASTIIYDPIPIYIYNEVATSVTHDCISERMLADSEEVFNIKKSIAARSNFDFSCELLSFSGSEVCGFARRILGSENSFSRKKELFGILVNTNFYEYAKKYRYKGDTLKRRLVYFFILVFSAIFHF